VTRLFKLFVICVAVCLLLCSCNTGVNDKGPTHSSPSTEDSTEYTDPAAPADGGISIRSATAGEILDYFSEIAFGSEFGTSSGRLCRWKDTIVYCISGSPKEKDIALVRELVVKLNTIPGFPGMAETEDAEDANFEIMFIPRSEIIEKFSNATDACVGMSEYNWSINTCEIISARAAIDCDEVTERNSTICEEVLQALGLAKDSYEHIDSVFYQGKCVYNRPSELDWALVQVLYHPTLRTGMSKYEAISAASGILAW